ncbi:DNA polymerase III subunit delta [Sphingobacterium sp. DK4209]|uniref:DNA polymerase III subunit delta n=1 Tax=Sphingobacterium zhuxiongii TaxID=2662364 RepID=A0A5Q0QDC9_9SPHI|nr:MULTISPECIES: DNA polymerase III subunit delta [unclassified Sphingobacterium]MVZ67485.1 DNA polymerase III subunit delta [Sphingobacterium sp. DK4209]QGA27229.1 DNA polymerase III subunit delta [Sphingobacterium sp. dk4302]
MNTQSILTDIKKKKLSPVYLLHGEEPYFIDLISDAIEHQVLDEAQKGFDQSVVYGKETDFSTLISMAKRYPMMSDYQVIIVKEAQNLKWKDDELLQKYLEHPTPTTVLVFAHKYSKFDKRKKSYKTLDKVGVVVESNKLYEDKVSGWINEQLSAAGRKIHPQAAAMMADYLGTDLSKVANELEKLMLNVSAEQEISAADIERNIGISKDFNVFELNTALSKRNSLKAFQIVNYFAANPKSNPIPVVIGSLGTYFTKILKYHYLPDKTSAAAAKALGVHPFFVKEYEYAARNFNRRKTFDIIHLIKEYDLKSKGMNVGPMTNHGDLMSELIYKILN